MYVARMLFVIWGAFAASETCEDRNDDLAVIMMIDGYTCDMAMNDYPDDICTNDFMKGYCCGTCRVLDLPKCKCPSFQSGSVDGSEMCEFNEKNCALKSGNADWVDGCPTNAVNCRLSLALPTCTCPKFQKKSLEGSEMCEFNGKDCALKSGKKKWADGCPSNAVHCELSFPSICLGEIDAHNEICALHTDEDSCNAEGVSLFSDGLCDWFLTEVHCKNWKKGGKKFNKIDTCAKECAASDSCVACTIGWSLNDYKMMDECDSIERRDTYGNPSLWRKPIKETALAKANTILAAKNIELMAQIQQAVGTSGTEEDFCEECAEQCRDNYMYANSGECMFDTCGECASEKINIQTVAASALIQYKKFFVALSIIGFVVACYSSWQVLQQKLQGDDFQQIEEDV